MNPAKLHLQTVRGLNEHEQAQVRGELREIEIDEELDWQRNIVAADAEKFVEDWIADPVGELAGIYKLIARHYNDPKKIGESLKTYLDQKIRVACEILVDKRTSE